MEFRLIRTSCQGSVDIYLPEYRDKIQARKKERLDELGGEKAEDGCLVRDFPDLQSLVDFADEFGPTIIWEESEEEPECEEHPLTLEVYDDHHS